MIGSSRRMDLKLGRLSTDFILGALLFSALANFYLGRLWFNTSEKAAEAHRQAQTVPDIISRTEPLNNTEPVFQIAVVSSFKQISRLERLVANGHEGWHQEFPGTRFYTFDHSHPDSPLSKLFTHMPKLFEHEKIEYKGNHQLAAIEYVYRDNPNADWYLIVDDDTVFVPVNLRLMIKDLKLKRDEFWYIGKCAKFTAELREDSSEDEKIHFIVGGAGILMSHALVKALAPVVQSCRRDYNHLTFGDGRIGACIEYTLNMSSVVRSGNSCADYLSEDRSQLGNIYKFYMGDVFDWSNREYKGNYRSKPSHEKTLMMNVHEKHVAHIQLFNEWFRNMSLANRTISWSAFQTDKVFLQQLNNTAE